MRLKLSWSFLFIFFSSYTLIAQSTCNGALAKPIVDITFGSGINPGPPLPGGTTNYTYDSVDCPEDGFYGIRTNSVNCFYGDWHSVMQDHTGDPDGYFMLVNGAWEPGIFFQDTITGFCSNTTYQFAAWVLEMDNPSACASTGLLLPNLTFTVQRLDGTVIQTYNTGTIPATAQPTWVQYGFFFTTPETNLVLRISNSTTGGCGNDLALDDITFSACNPIVSTNVGDASQSSSTYFCYGTDTSVNFSSSVSSGYNNLQYQWQSSNDSGKTWININGATDSIYTNKYPGTSPPGLYLNRLVVAESPNINTPGCQVISDSSTVAVEPIPVPATDNNSPVCSGNSITLNASGGSSYTWMGPNGLDTSGQIVTIPGAKLADAGKYTVAIISQYGCVALDTSNIVVYPSPTAIAGPDTSVCEETSVQLIGSGGTSYMWSPAAGLSNDSIADPLVAPSDTTVYTLTVANEYGCTDTASTVINTLQKPQANAGPERQMTQGQTITLNGQASGYDISYYWSPDSTINDTAILQPTINPLVSKAYTLHVISNAGCGVATSDVYVLVYKKIEIPNAFSPNGDGINDVWYIEALQTYPTAELSVFSRSGQLVFHCTGYNQPWNGTYNGHALPIGTYYYIIDLKNGTSLKSGSVTILR